MSPFENTLVDLFRFAVLSAALTYYITQSVLLAPLRKLLRGSSSSNLGYLLYCPSCVGTWMGLVLYLVGFWPALIDFHPRTSGAWLLAMFTSCLINRVMPRDNISYEIDRWVADDQTKEGEDEQELEQEGITEYRLKIARRSDSGNLSALKTVVVTLAEMANLEDSLNEYAGGGPYLIQAFHPEEQLNRLFAFRLHITGNPKIPVDRAQPSRAAAAAAANAASGGERTIGTQLFSLPTPAVPGTTFGPPLMASPTDRIAMGSVDDAQAQRRQLEADVKEIRKQLDEERMQNAKRIETERIERDRVEREAERARHAAEMQHMKDMISANAKPRFNLTEIVAAATPFIPLAVAMIDARKHAASVEADRVARMNEIQMSGANKLMEATLAQRSENASGNNKLLETLLPVALPVIQAIITSNGPKAQAELMATQAEVQMQQTAMVAQMFEQLAGQAPDHPMLPLIQSTIESITAGVQAWAKAQARPSTAQTVVSTIQEQLGQTPPKLEQEPAPIKRQTQGDEIATAVFNHPACPQELKTQEWFTILSMMHNGEPVDSVAQTIANHLLNLDTTKTTPALIEPVWAKPEETLTRIFSFLPVWQADQPYAKEVIYKVIDILSAPVEEDEDDDDEEGDDEEGDDKSASPATEPAAAQ